MTTRGSAWLGCALLFAAACSHGGQSGDDGHPVGPHLRDGGAKHDSGPATQPDAGGVVFVGPGVSVPDGEPGVVCGSGFKRVAGHDALADVGAGPYRCLGMPGWFDCSCDGKDVVSRAAGCIGALREACDKDPDPIEGGPAPPPTDCESTLYTRAGRCELERAGEFSCKCEGASKAEHTKADSCERALWTLCAKTCEDATGSCHADTSAPFGHYACDCAQYDGLTRNVVDSECEVALADGCSLDLGYSQLCNAYSGFCDQDGDEYACTCVDGTHGRTPVVDRFASCRYGLEDVCGDDAPEGKQCSVDRNGYHAHCVQPVDDAAPFRCDCVFGESIGAVSDFDSVTAKDCDAALTSFCPQITVNNYPTARDGVCAYYDICDPGHPGFDLATCKASAPDACIACTSQALQMLDKGADGCPVESVPCSEQCKELVSKDTAVAACKDMLQARDKATPETNCLCEGCWPDFGECLADAGCTKMFDCAAEQGCEGQACASDPVCGPIIKQFLGTHSLAVLLRVGDCPARPMCITPP